MKPAPFDYAAPETLTEAVDLLGEDALVLAGGQSLVPMLNRRLARPSRLVDLNRIRELATLTRRDGSLWIGATVRQATLERSPLVARGWPLLQQAVRYAGHAAIRSRGTVGGSAAHADPNAELPVALIALDARFHVRGPRGEVLGQLNAQGARAIPSTTADLVTYALQHVIESGTGTAAWAAGLFST